MAAEAALNRLLAAVLFTALVAGALLAPVPAAAPPVPWSPVEAAFRTEDTIAPVGLVWGRLRGWSRVEDGWELVWQPAHGAWLVRTWTGDGPGEPEWRLEAAPWLPGSRLTRRAAGALLDTSATPAVREDRLGRRDWRIGTDRLLGALPAGTSLPLAAPRTGWWWTAVIAGLLLAGTVARVVFPAVPRRLARYTVAAVVVALAVTLPWDTALAASVFRVGVRPWVTEMVAMTVAALVLGAVLMAVISFPAAVARAEAAMLAVALPAGLLAGRLAPGTVIAEVGGLNDRVVVWAGAIVVGGWLAALAGDGLRQLLGGTSRWRRWLLLVAAVGAVAAAGEYTGVLVAVLAAAAVERGQGTWMGGLVLLGWLAGGAFVSCAWTSVLRDALALLLVGVGLVAWLVVRRETPVSVPAP